MFTNKIRVVNTKTAIYLALDWRIVIDFG